MGTECVGGFLSPKVDERKCVRCGKCKEVCPVENSKDRVYGSPIADARCYVAWHKDLTVRQLSSSGGLFSAFAQQTLDDDGVVFGAAFDENMVLRHRGVTRHDDLDRLRRSKYVQSDCAGVYREIEQFLRADKKVLFCGTPCQTAGLRACFGPAQGNLTLLSLACHGVPSPSVFAKYVEWIEQKYNDKVSDINWRNKRYGWTCGTFPIVSFKRRKPKTLILENNFFLRAFLTNNDFMRPACGFCSFRAYSSGADITLADFWRIDQSFAESRRQEESYGYSAVLVHTRKGAELLGRNTFCQFEERPISWVLEYNTGFGSAQREIGLSAEQFLMWYAEDPSCAFMRGRMNFSMGDRIRALERLLTKSAKGPLTRAMKVLQSRKKGRARCEWCVVRY
jgi:coenzyme F420-reducing hydrogenase beta subunit